MRDAGKGTLSVSQDNIFTRNRMPLRLNCLAYTRNRMRIRMWMWLCLWWLLFFLLLLPLLWLASKVFCFAHAAYEQ